MDTIVYRLEDRGNQWMFHWIMFVMSGLKNLEDKPKPIYFTTNVKYDFQRETLKFFEPEYIFVEKVPEGAKDIYCHGTPMSIIHDKSTPIYHKWIRDWVLDKNGLRNHKKQKRRIYMSRNISMLLPWNVGNPRRILVNENEIYEPLKKLGFEIINLEDYSMIDKIKLFQEAEIVISPNSGGLTFSIFAHPETKIIEINTHLIDIDNQYENSCYYLNIFYNRYNNITPIDVNGNIIYPNPNIGYNMKLNDPEHFMKYIESIIVKNEKE